jgi:hypothetical protein
MREAAARIRELEAQVAAFRKATCPICRGTGYRSVSGSIQYDAVGKKMTSSSSTIPCVCGSVVQVAAPAVQPGAPITMTYRNYRGEVADRTVIPRRIWWGATDWHTEPGWLMTAFDVEKGAERDFALADADFRQVAAS